MKNTDKIARDAFASSAIALVQRALAEGLGAHVLIDPHGQQTHADLHDANGAELVSIRLHATQLALPLAGPVAPSQPPAAEAPAHPLMVGARIVLDAVLVEVIGVDEHGFVWREYDPEAVTLDEGETLWREAQHITGDVWRTRTRETPAAAPPPVVDPPKPAAKKPRAKKASAAVAKGEPSAPVVEAPAASMPGPWLLVEHPVGAPPVEARHEARIARRFYDATGAHGDGLRRIELFDDKGSLIESRDFGVPTQPTRGLDGVPASVPAHLRDLAALTSPDWWCVVVQQAVRPDLTIVRLCSDESAAAATADSARFEDDSADSATRIVVFTPTGEVHDAWHRHEPAVSAAVEAHPDVELFRVATPMADAFADIATWSGARGIAWYSSSYQRNTPDEVREGNVWLCWGRQNGDAVAIVPRALVALVERRAAGWGLALSIEPWTASAECSALRVGSRVDLRGEEWRVFLLPDNETATLTRDPDELVDVALAEVHPSGTWGWWAERAKPKDTAKKAPKRAKGGAK